MAIKDIIQSQIQKTKEVRQKQLASSTNAVQSGSTNIPTQTETPKVTNTAKAVSSITEKVQKKIETTKTAKDQWETVPNLLWRLNKSSSEFADNLFEKHPIAAQGLDLIEKAVVEEWKWKDLIKIAIQDLWNAMWNVWVDWSEYIWTKAVELVENNRLRMGSNYQDFISDTYAKSIWLNDEQIEILKANKEKVMWLKEKEAEQNIQNVTDFFQRVRDNWNEKTKWWQHIKDINDKWITLVEAIKQWDAETTVWLFSNQLWTMLPTIAATIAWWEAAVEKKLIWRMIWWLSVTIPTYTLETEKLIEEDESINVSREQKERVAFVAWTLKAWVEVADTIWELFWLGKRVPVKSNVLLKMLARKWMSVPAEVSEEAIQAYIDEYALQYLGTDKWITDLGEWVTKYWPDVALYALLFPTATSAWIQQKNINTIYNEVEEQVRKDIPDATEEQVKEIARWIIEYQYWEEDIKKLESQSESLYEEKAELEKTLEQAETEKQRTYIVNKIKDINNQISKIDDKIEEREDKLRTLNENIWEEEDMEEDEEVLVEQTPEEVEETEETEEEMTALQAQILNLEKASKQDVQRARQKIQSMLDNKQLEWYSEKALKERLEEIKEAFYQKREEEIKNEQEKKNKPSLNVKQTKDGWWMPSIKFYDDENRMMWEWNPFAWTRISNNATQEQREYINEYMDKELETKEEKSERENNVREEIDKEERAEQVENMPEEEMEQKVEENLPEVSKDNELAQADEEVQVTLEDVEWEEYEEMQENTSEQQKTKDETVDTIGDNAEELEDMVEEQQYISDVEDDIFDNAEDKDNPYWVEKWDTLSDVIKKAAEKNVESSERVYKKRSKWKSVDEQIKENNRHKKVKSFAWSMIKAFTPSLSRLFNLSPRLAWAVTTYEATKWMLINKYKKKTKPFVDALAKLKKENPEKYKALSLALFDFWMVDDIDIKEALKEAWIDPKLFEDVASVLDEIANNYKEAWLDITINDKYFPRKVKDYWLLSDYISKKAAQKSLNRVLNIWNNEDMNPEEKIHRIENTLSEYYNVEWKIDKIKEILNSNISDEEKIDKINESLDSKFSNKNKNWILGQIKKISENEALSEWEKEKQIHRILINNLTRPSERSNNAKDRKITLSDWRWTEQEQEEWRDIVDYYEDPIKALELYIDDMVKKTELRKMLWWMTDNWDAISDKFDDSLSRILEEDDNLTEKEAEEAKEIINAIINKKATTDWIWTLKSATYMVTITNTLSAMQQLEDLSKAILKWPTWFRNTIKVILKKSWIKMSDTWLDNAFAMIEWMWFQEFLFKYSWFDAVDRLWKLSFLNTAYDTCVRQANHKNRYKLLLHRLIEMYWEIKGNRLFEKYKNNWLKDKDGNLDIEIMSDLLYQLGNTQPIYDSWLPQWYLNSPSLRILYCLSTFTIKQIDWVIQWTKETYRNQLIMWRSKWTAATLATLSCIWRMTVQSIISAIITELINWAKWDKEDTVTRTLLNEWREEALKKFGVNALAWLLKVFNISKYDQYIFNKDWPIWVLMSKVMPAIWSIGSDLFMILAWKKDVDDILKYTPFIGKPIYYRLKNNDMLPEYRLRWNSKSKKGSVIYWKY